ncbi:MAG: hypothetical protein EXQ77_02000 [Thermoleophilia bacterium]|nr:hypothetical protein [Thermoleophilia bacterium]
MVPLHSLLTAAGRAFRAVALRRRSVAVTLAVAQVAVTVALALALPHNGWVWYAGGDQIWFTTYAALLGDWTLPLTHVAAGWAILLVPLSLMTGPTYVDVLPLLVPLQVLVVGPAAVLLVLAAARRIAGDAFALLAGVAWVAAPLLSLGLFVERYDDRWFDAFLGQALGLTSMSDYPSLVLLLGASVLVLRSLQGGGRRDAALAGVVFGLAVLVKPPNLLFGVGALLAYLVARRWREGATAVVACLPGLVALYLWKARGLTDLPLLGLQEVRLTAGAAVGQVAAGIDIARYLDADIESWRTNMSNLREFTVSARLVQWAPVAGLLVIARRSRPAAALLVGWLGAYLIVKGASDRASIENGSFWRLVLPAWPAYLLLVSAVPLLFPGVQHRLGCLLTPPPLGRRAPIRSPRGVALVALVAVVTLVPLALTGLARPIIGPERALLVDDVGNELYVPVTAVSVPTAAWEGDNVRVTWGGVAGGPASGFVLFRADEGTDVSCNLGAVDQCRLVGEPIARTTLTTWTDGAPPAGSIYRVGRTTSYLGPQGDVFELSRPTAPLG